MRLLFLATGLVLCACASGGGSTNDTPVMQQNAELTRVETPAGTIEINWERERTYDETKLLVSVDKAWATLPAVFGELGIEPGLVDFKQHVFGNAGAKYRGELGRQRISEYFDCGATAGMSNADTYDVLIRVISQLIPADGGLSTLRIQAEATAHPSALSGQSVRCASTGALEARIASMISQQALRSGA